MAWSPLNEGVVEARSNPTPWARRPRITSYNVCYTKLLRASLSRTWALLIAAFIFYLPANLLPIMRTVSLGDVDDNTILSGVVELWVKGSPDLAVIVFTASILVPMLKFLVLGTLLIT